MEEIVKEEIPRFYRGSKYRPITNKRDLESAMIGRRNMIIYVRDFVLNERILQEIKCRNIEKRCI